MEIALGGLSHVLGFKVITTITGFILDNVILKQPKPSYPDVCQKYEEARNKDINSVDFFTQYPTFMSEFQETPTSHLVQASQTVHGDTLQSYLEHTMF